MQKHLVELANLLGTHELYGDTNVMVEDVSADSRRFQGYSEEAYLRRNHDGTESV